MSAGAPDTLARTGRAAAAGRRHQVIRQGGVSPKRQR
ncbi:hypothetical protein EES47_27655 [Streptomyces sp. ADI98-12]|uniref:Uncharacterized protein n=1 Tax=Streptomyces griseus TaxID=1911 RepID=A0A380NAH3_STRGR|nr:hypothetical protein EES47_27655 [Streptomyces sp. ADI98-12]SUP36242.1 Uncharacterised protein [Streptomyces griseus]